MPPQRAGPKEVRRACAIDAHAVVRLSTRRSDRSDRLQSALPGHRHVRSLTSAEHGREHGSSHPSGRRVMTLFIRPLIGFTTSTTLFTGIMVLLSHVG